jgi:hypothetical protein
MERIRYSTENSEEPEIELQAWRYAALVVD